MKQQEVFDGGDAAVGSVEWDAVIRERALTRLGRQPPRSLRYARTVALALLIALHALIFVFWYASRFPLPSSNPTVVQVRLIDESTPPPHVPEPVAPSHPTSHMAAAMLPAPAPTPTPVAAPNATAAAGTQPLIFNRDGSIALPPGKATPLEKSLARGRELLARGHNIIHCRRSRFDNSPTPAQAAAAAARGARMAHLVMGNPLDPLNDVGQQQHLDAASDRAARKREIEEQACDY